jgi:hypothetical protein
VTLIAGPEHQISGRGQIALSGPSGLAVVVDDPWGWPGSDYADPLYRPPALLKLRWGDAERMFPSRAVRADRWRVRDLPSGLSRLVYSVADDLVATLIEIMDVQWARDPKIWAAHDRLIQISGVGYCPD